MGWEVEINAQDDDGNTPLHLAVENAKQFDGIRSLRDLLLKGAERNIYNKNRQRPIDILEQIDLNKEKKYELREALLEPIRYCRDFLAMFSIKSGLAL
jgi:ankyrin repeat protein